MPSYKSILQTSNYLAGQWVSSENKSVILDKYSQEPIAEISLGSSEQMETATKAATKAFLEFRTWSAGKRSEYLTKLHIALKNNLKAFTELIVAEAGKPYNYAQMEVERAILTLQIAATEALRFGGEVVPMDFNIGESKTAFTKRFPIGPIACISPFNFPLNLAMHKIAPALAVGCTLVLKPAPQAPLSCLAFAKLCEETGYPAGVVNVIACDIPVAEKMVKDDRFKMLSFTGSPQVGWYLKTICGKKKVALELGGNAAVIIDETADLAQAAKITARGAYLYAGQICISTQRIYVLQSVYQAFTELLIKEIQDLKVGNPADANTTVGPIIDTHHFNRIKTWVEEAQKSGAKTLTSDTLDSKHNLYSPILLTNTQSDMKVVADEVFGPVAIIEPVATFQDAIHQTNASIFGLQTGIFSNNFNHIKLVHNELEVGGIIINNIPGFRMDNMPYGGVKDSGLGREGLKYAMDEMTEPRLIVY